MADLSFYPTVSFRLEENFFRFQLESVGHDDRRFIHRGDRHGENEKWTSPSDQSDVDSCDACPSNRSRFVLKQFN